jgi:hypothetical protein
MPKRSRQLSFTLRTRPTWGGRRAGAGRRPKRERAEVRHGSREAFRCLPAHVTLRLRPGLPSLRSVPIVRAIEATFARGCARRDFRLVHYSRQGNHAHLIVEADDRAELGRGMMAIGARLARALNRVTGRRGHLLADRYHHRLLRTPTEVRHALRYDLLNARKHVGKRAAALRAVGELLDPASSARWFDGWKRRADGTGHTANPEPPTGPAPVARARTWLLASGWRRLGWIDPRDVPGVSP